MAQGKFDEIDRQKVIKAVESAYNVALSPVGRRRKHLQDQSGRPFWVFGGYDHWHGIPKEMMTIDTRRAAQGVLVIALRYSSRIDIYSGTLAPLIQERNRLPKTEKDYQFNLKFDANTHESITIREISGLHLNKISTIIYDNASKEADSAVNTLQKIIRRTPEKQMHVLLKRLKADHDG